MFRIATSLLRAMLQRSVRGDDARLREVLGAEHLTVAAFAWT